MIRWGCMIWPAADIRHTLIHFRWRRRREKQPLYYIPYYRTNSSSAPERHSTRRSRPADNRRAGFCRGTCTVVGTYAKSTDRYPIAVGWYPGSAYTVPCSPLPGGSHRSVRGYYGRWGQKRSAYRYQIHLPALRVG